MFLGYSLCMLFCRPHNLHFKKKNISYSLFCAVCVGYCKLEKIESPYPCFEF